MIDRMKALLRIHRVAGAYRTLFGARTPGMPASDVLTDLRAFCWPMGAVEKKAASIPLERLEGRREVFERILTLALGSHEGIEREIQRLKELHDG